MKTLLLFVALLALMTACAKVTKVEFNATTNLEQDVPNPGRQKLKCGEKFPASFTNTDSTFGTLDVNNVGGCDVEVLLKDAADNEVAKFKLTPNQGQIAAFALKPNTKFNFLFTCLPSESGGCEFTYRFSTGKKSTDPKPELESPAIMDRPVMPQGSKTGNTCPTITGGEAIGKIISNLTDGEVRVIFTAESTCLCTPFRIFAEPIGSPNKVAQTDKPKGSATDGLATIPAGKTIMLKASCGTNVAPGPCSGNIKGIKISLRPK